MIGLSVALLALLCVACDPPQPPPKYSTSAEDCVFKFVNNLTNVDHEQPSNETMQTLIEFCREERGSR